MTAATSDSLILGIFIIGYLSIIFEFYLKVNKSAVGIAMAGFTWMAYFVSKRHPLPMDMEILGHHLSDVTGIIFFLLGAMTLVELIDSHKGFNTLVVLIKTRSKRLVFIVISFVAFFLSAVLDNLTTTILLISILRKLIPERKERISLCCMVVIAANAGGAWTPIGDVTTTMLWINGKISTLVVMKEIFLPSLISMCVALGYFLIFEKGNYAPLKEDIANEAREPGSRLVLIVGFLALLSVPMIKWATGLPPFMGMLIALCILWFVTDFLHNKYDDRDHLRVPFILTKIDVSSILFFLGILLSINALETIGSLQAISSWLDHTIRSPTWIATLIGFFSAIIDNVPLVAASMGMYTYELNNSFWLIVAYTAGVGGSMLSIGSAAGVALMGIEKVDFITYFKRASLPALKRHTQIPHHWLRNSYAPHLIMQSLGRLFSYV